MNPHLFSLNSHCAPLFLLLLLLCRLFTIGLTPCCIRRHILPSLYHCKSDCLLSTNCREI
jgi:hypothetical protein